MGTAAACEAGEGRAPSCPSRVWVSPGAPSGLGDPQGAGPRAWGPGKSCGGASTGRRQEAGAGPALPDVRGYTSPRGQAAGSTAGWFAARALLLLQDGPAGRGAAARPPSFAGHPLGKPWGSSAPWSGTQRDTRALQGCKKERCNTHREAKAALERVGEVLVSTCHGWGWLGQGALPPASGWELAQKSRARCWDVVPSGSAPLAVSAGSSRPDTRTGRPHDDVPG